MAAIKAPANPQSYEALLQKEKYLEVINSFATSLIEAETIDEIVWTVAKQAIAKLDYYDCVIYLYDEKSKSLIQSAAFGPKSPIENKVINPIKIKPGQGIVGTVFQTGIAEIVNDTSLDSRYIVDDEVRLSEISIPLVHKGVIIGVLDSEHPERNFFTELDYNMLSTVAAMLSTKIEQARSNSRVRKYQINLERLVSRKTRQLEESNRDLIAKNREKEILLKEIHHRVKNNMQIIISLLNIQANSASSEHETKVFNECKDRIRSMALIHERLYLENDISKITFEEYTGELMKELSASYTTAHEVSFELNIQPVQISIDTAIPLGLILNEIVTNSLKHAFTSKGGILTVKATHNNADMVLVVRDTGKGFDYDNYSGLTFGIELINILVSQINGTLSYSNKNGSQYTITFPLN
jgi:two-component sensor histidine kinase/putative methionine-R-sulfoxide reductase with GAF domain